MLDLGKLGIWLGQFLTCLVGTCFVFDSSQAHLNFHFTDQTSQRLLQRILDPLQQLLADGCHLTRETGKYISEAGFSSVDSNTGYISSALFINPHLYGIAQK